MARSLHHRLVAWNLKNFDPGYPVRPGGSTVMWKSMLDEPRAVVWLASVIGGVSAVGVGMAVVLAAT